MTGRMTFRPEEGSPSLVSTNPDAYTLIKMDDIRRMDLSPPHLTATRHPGFKHTVT
jgi:hypothetical protein